MKSKVLLQFPHQLFDLSKFKGLQTQVKEVVLIEEPLLFTHYAFHRKKLMVQRASMKAYAAELVAQNFAVRYVEMPDTDHYLQDLLEEISDEGITIICCFDVCDNWLEKKITMAAHQSKLKVEWLQNSAFLLSKEQLSQHFNINRKKYLHNTFYTKQRQNFNILLDETGKPLGGKWSFDNENRNTFPRRAKAPSVLSLAKNSYEEDAVQWVDKKFPNNPGSTEGGLLRYPITRKEAEIWLQNFLEERFCGFGTYEDAIVSQEFLLHHSLLSPLLNCGLLTPELVISSAINYAFAHKIPLNDVEGFVRQIIGWREFIRGLYIFHGTQQRTGNYFNFTYELPATFYTGTTGILPVDDVIKKVISEAYCHHIERLMILGCFMLLTECHPHGVYQWFMEHFIDAYDWVMVPNVYGMSQFADGGLMATKPYICASNYVLKMSNYQKGDWCEIWDALFWRFLARHKDKMKNNPRLSLLLGQFNRKPQSDRQQQLNLAEDFLQRFHNQRN